MLLLVIYKGYDLNHYSTEKKVRNINKIFALLQCL